MSETIQELLFVYNADTSLYAQATDYVRKIMRPDTYQCNLCKLTYGLVSMKKEWGDFIKNLPLTTTFLHRDEFHDKHPELAGVALPAVFCKTTRGLTELISASEIDEQQDITGLKKLLHNKLKHYEV